MEAGKIQKRWTYEEFAGIPSKPGQRCEVIAGELFVSSAPTPRHQMVVKNVIVVANELVESNGLGSILPGPVAVLFGESDYLIPDLLFVSNARQDFVTSRGVEGPPELVVEVISGSTASRDRGIKRERYALHGVREYWIADAATHTLEVWQFERGAASAVVCSANGHYPWKPTPDGPTLDVTIAEIFAGVR